MGTIKKNKSKAEPIPNGYISSIIAANITPEPNELSDASQSPRTELDSHANMIVIGKHSFIFDSVHGRNCDVQPFDPSIGTAKQVPIVDAAIAYDCPHTHKTYLLLTRNALYVPTLEHNLIPPFIFNVKLVLR